MPISEKYRFKVIEDYFKKYGITNIQLESFNFLISHSLQQIIKEEPIIKIKIKKDQYYIVEFTQITLDSPYQIEEDRTVNYITPCEARLREMTYDGSICINISTKIVDIINKKETVLESKNFNRICIGRMPIMLQSSKCNLHNMTKEEKIKAGECMKDTGGYFIIRGKERVLVSQERINYNIIHVYKQKNNSKWKYISDIRSMSEETGHSVLIQAKINTKDSIYFSLPYITQDIPVGIVFKALGYNNNDIIKIISENEDNKHIIEHIIKMSYNITSKEDALEYIGKFSMHIIPKEKRVPYAQQIFDNELFPHLGICISNKEKALFLGLMIQKIINVYIGRIHPDDRDHLNNKRCETSGVLVCDIFRSLYKRFIRSIQPHLQKRQDIKIAISRVNIITQGLKHCFSTGNWGVHKNSYVRAGVSQILNRLSYGGTISHFQRLVIPIGKEGKNTQIRQLHNSQIGYVCPAETPEGHSAGIVKNFCTMIKVSKNIPTIMIKDIIENINDPDLIFLNNLKIEDNSKLYKILLNGVWIGSTTNHIKILGILKTFRTNNILHKDISISINDINKEILIFSDQGRLLRPVMSIKDNKILLSETDNIDWDYLVDNHKIQYLDSYEIENKCIAMFEHELYKGYHYDYCEIHPSLMLGVCASIIPFPDHTQSPRNTYQSAMGKQAFSLYATSNDVRSDTIVHMLQYPQKPAVYTHMSEFMGFNDMPSGINVIVAIMSYTGFNQEDSVIFNQSSIDKGLFRSISFRTIMTQERKKSTNNFENICVPDKDIQAKNYNYQKLDENGIIRIGEVIELNDIVVGKVLCSTKKNGKETKTDCSVRVKKHETGIVDKIFINNTPNGYKMVKIKIRKQKIPEMGDKFASREAQKGTVGIVLPAADMPYTQDGIIPDIIVNPHCIPSRMTINQLLEMLGAKSTVMNGNFKDCTAFSESSTGIIHSLQNELCGLGYNQHGNERLSSGLTGEQLEADIFIGPAYYQRLKHLVSEKIHARDHGSVQCLTRQPLEGRSRNGGLRFGEMERDCMISHGVPAFLKERLLDMSDPYEMLLCESCGQITTNKHECHICKNENIHNTTIPYACKLLFQELIAIGLKIKLIPQIK